MRDSIQQIAKEMRAAASDFEPWGRDVIEGFAERLEAGPVSSYSYEFRFNPPSVCELRNPPADSLAVLVGKWREYAGKSTRPEAAYTAKFCADQLEQALQADAREKGEASKWAMPMPVFIGNYKHNLYRNVGSIEWKSKPLAERLSVHADDCAAAADESRDIVIGVHQLRAMHDDLREAAALATQPAQASDADAPEAWTPLHGIPDWAIAKAYRDAVNRFDAESRGPSATIFASNVTVAADHAYRDWSRDNRDLATDPQSLAEWLRVHYRGDFPTPELRWIHTLLSATSSQETASE